MGMSPTKIQGLRASVAATTGIKASGKCATASIALTFGEDHDPTYTIRKDQVCEWIHLWLGMQGDKYKAERMQVRTCWTKLMRDSQEDNRWKRVKGPAVESGWSSPAVLRALSRLVCTGDC